MIGKIVGSSDLLAQMADRNYLEKLFLLFKEFEEAGLPGFDSELDLLQKTETFYNSTARQRLNEEFNGISRVMRTHFKERWGIDKDLYAESILKNITYLKTTVAKCEEDFACYFENLRRGDFSRKIPD